MSTQIQREFTEKWRETERITLFSIKFHYISCISERFSAISTQNRAKHRRFHRFRPCFPCSGSGRENPRKKQGGDNPSMKIPKPSPRRPGLWGAAAAFQDSSRTGQTAHRISHRKIFEPFFLIRVLGV